jgi:hypothetical protein
MLPLALHHGRIGPRRALLRLRIRRSQGSKENLEKGRGTNTRQNIEANGIGSQETETPEPSIPPQLYRVKSCDALKRWSALGTNLAGGTVTTPDHGSRTLGSRPLSLCNINNVVLHAGPDMAGSSHFSTLYTRLIFARSA